MKIPLKPIPDKFVRYYKSHNRIHSYCIYLIIKKGLYGLIQTGKLANDLLRIELGNHGYYKTQTPGLWKHNTRPVIFTLVVDDFGVKFVGHENAIHILNLLQKYYETDADWSRSRYIGITIK